MKLKHTYLAALLGVAMLAGCGGGGGGDGGGRDATLTLSGVAAKGVLLGAQVKVYALKADGSVGDVPLVETTTGDASSQAPGRYTLPVFQLPESGRYVVVVSGRKFKDEVTGDVITLAEDAPPLTLRALGGSQAGGTGTLHVTPFSEMMLAALESGGKIDVAKAEQARTNMVALLGFDPREVAPKTIEEAAQETDPARREQQLRLAVMLTAVSKMANTNAVPGCEGELAQKTACVVGKLAQQSELDSLKPGELGAALAAAVQAVVQDKQDLVGNTSFYVTLDRLNCVGEDCKPPEADSNTPAVQAARQFFTDIKTTLLMLFGDGRFGSGALGLQASRFKDSLESVAPPVDMTGKLALTLLGGAQGYYNYRAGTGPVQFSDLGGAYSGNAPSWGYGASCGLFQDVNRTISATEASNANYLGCSTRYRVMVNQDAYGNVLSTDTWRHRVFLTPDVPGGSKFSYEMIAQKTTCPGPTISFGTCPVAQRQNVTLQSGDATQQSGTLTLTRNAAGEITGFDISGALPGTFDDRDGSLYNPLGKAVWSVKGNYTEQLSGTVVTQQKITLDGSVSIYEKTSDTVAQSTLALAQGTQVVATPKGLSGLNANLKFTTAGAQMEGTLAMTEPALDKSKTRLAPMKTVFSGALRTKEAGGFADILNGELSVAVNAAQFGAYDMTLDDSATNRFQSTVGVKGKVAAPGHAAIQMTAALAGYSDGTGATADVTTDFLKADGTKLRSVKLTAPEAGTLLFTEPGTNVSVTVVHGQRLHPVKKDGVEVGVINRDTGIVTFKDGSFISLN